jgi:ketosteroid isomerase-like protein
MHFELVEVRDCGDGVTVTSQRIVGRFRLTGIDLDHTWGSIVKVKSGRIASARGFRTPDQARRAVGIELD